MLFLLVEISLLCLVPAPLLCQHRMLTPSLLRGALKQAPARALLLDLLNEGYLVIYEND